MENEKVSNLDDRILKMSNEEICEILIDKDGWQEEVYSRAVAEAKSRNIGMEQLESKHEEMESKKIEIAAAELTSPEKVMFMFSFIVFPIGILAEKYRAEGYTTKLKQAKFYKMIGKPIIFGGFLAIVAICFYIRSLIDQNN
jgi:hypothetical protein